MMSMTVKAVQHWVSMKMNCPQLTTQIPKQRWLFNFAIIVARKLVMLWRSPWPIQIIIPIVAAFIIGKIHGFEYTINEYPNNIVSSMVCMGVLSMITHVRTFTLDKVVIKRETDTKIGIWPFFIAYNVVDALWIFAIPVMFMVPYYYLTYPNTPLAELFGVAVMTCWWTSGVAYVISSLPIAMHWANLIAVFVSVIFGAFLQGLDPTINESENTFQGVLIHLSYNRWVLEIMSIAEFSYYQDVQPNQIWSTMDKIGICGQHEQTINRDRPSMRQMVDLYDVLNKDVKEHCSQYTQNAYLWLFGYGCLFRLVALLIFWYNTHPIWARVHFFLKYMPIKLWRRIKSITYVA
jgi:hypothetical protein